MAEEIRLPREGMSTIGAQYTRVYLERVLAAVRKLKDQGWPEPRILDKMRAELHSFTEHDIKRLFDLAVENPVEDDVPAADVQAERTIKEGTVELDVARIPKFAEVGSLLRFQGSDWYIAGKRASTLVLKKIR
jgi:hypothetical protein